MYSTELRQPGWRSMPLVLRIIMGLGMASGVVALWASYWAADEAREASEQARTASQAAQEAVERIDREGLERDYLLCTNANEARAGIYTFVEGLIVNDGDGVVTEGEQVVLDFAAETFGPKPCPPDPSP